MTNQYVSVPGLACPECRGALAPGAQGLACAACGRSYGLSSGIPDLYVDRTTGDLSSRVEAANVQHYDTNVSNFQKNVIRHDDDYYAYERETLHELSGDGSGRILDLGTGTGKILQLAKPFYAELHGLDVSVHMLEQARKITPLVVRGSALSIPYEDGFFDVVTSHSVLHHIVQLEEALAEIRRVLKPGGVFYSDTDANKAFVEEYGWYLQMRRKLKGRLFEGADEEIERLSDIYHQSGLDPESVRGTALAAGFDEAEIRYHYPQNPDEFTRMLMRLDAYERSPKNSYYFVLMARKGR